jgi:hypothetical protein
MGRLRETYEDATHAADELKRHPTAGDLVTNVTVRPSGKGR